MSVATGNLRLAVEAEFLYPIDVAYMARTDFKQVRMTGLKPANLDTVTTTLIGLLGSRLAVRHRAGITDEILETLERAGLQVDEDIRAYETAEEAEAHAEALIAKGYRLVSAYPLREGRFAPEAQLVPPELRARLNSKEFLDRIVQTHLAAVIRSIAMRTMFSAMSVRIS
jgi:hypothetical protein